jgi:hypothetical protein
MCGNCCKYLELTSNDRKSMQLSVECFVISPIQMAITILYSLLLLESSNTAKIATNYKNLIYLFVLQSAPNELTSHIKIPSFSLVRGEQLRNKCRK